MCPGGVKKITNAEPGIVKSFSPRLNIVSSETTMASAAVALPDRHQSKFSSLKPNGKSCSAVREDEKEEACRHCGSYSLHVDWAQGDRVCTHCGVVAEEKLLDDRPEWREFNEAEDLAKGLPAAARCGFVPIDESRYLGGLQPTSLAKHAYGGNLPSSSNNNAKLATIRKRLLSTNRKIDYMMGQRHARALKNARVSRLVRKRQLMEAAANPNSAIETDQSDLDSVVTASEDDVRPELEQILIREEQDVHRLQATLNADKWSLRRAILLHGQHESLEEDQHAMASELDDLQKRLDSKLRKASADLYQAYQMLLQSSQRLQLPDRVTHEATTMLCRYVARRDGFLVKGVSSRLAVKKNNLSAVQHKQAAEKLREHNKMKQMGSLCAALLLLTARKLGWPRPLTEVCSCVQPAPPSYSSSRSPYAATSNNDCTFIKPKHCSRAMDEIKSCFPDYARSIAAVAASPSVDNPNSNSDDHVSTIHFVDHAVRKLQLPPVAEASIRALVWHYRQEQRASGHDSGTKLSTVCASIAYFVCLSGSVMQQLASQAQSREIRSNRRKTKFVFSVSAASSNSKSNKKDVPSNMGPPPPKKVKLTTQKTINSCDMNGDNYPEESIDKNDSTDEPFDVFSHGIDSEMKQQKREYEMRRVWDAWATQTTWLRSLSDVEQSSGVSGGVVLSHYKSSIYPRRQALLEWLRDAVQDTAANTKSDHTEEEEATMNVLTETPLASVLLSHVVAAGPLLNPQGKQEIPRK